MARQENGGTNSLLLFGALGVAGYFVYEYFFAPAAAPAAPAAGGTPAAPAAPAAGTTPAAPSGSSSSTTSQLDTLYTNLIAKITAANDPNFTGTGNALSGSAYHFNVYLQLIYTGTIPDVSTVFGSVAAASANMTASAFWAAMAPALQAANPGLSGYGFRGLGFYGGLGALARAGGRR